MRLRRTEQCAKCPWRKSTDPNTIPNGYDPAKHAALKGTIAPPDTMQQVQDYLNEKPLRIMACHEDECAHCIGWLKNQLGQGGNIRLRIALNNCENLGDVKLHGEQHETFEDTLPRPKIDRKKNLPTRTKTAKVSPR